MKKLLTIMFVLLVSQLAMAKEYKFKWTDRRDVLQYKVEASDWETAFKSASMFCFKFLMKKEVRFSEERGLDIIDVCANPDKGSYDL